MHKKAWNVMDIQPWIIFVRTDKKILRQAQLVRSQYLVGNCQHFLRTVYFLIRRITLATDREQQWVHASWIYRMHSMQTIYLLRDSIPGNLMDQSAKASILLRGSTDHRKGPNRVSSVIYFMHMHERKRMS